MRGEAIINNEVARKKLKMGAAAGELVRVGGVAPAGGEERKHRRDDVLDRVRVRVRVRVVVWRGSIDEMTS